MPPCNQLGLDFWGEAGFVLQGPVFWKRGFWSCPQKSLGFLALCSKSARVAAD